ncbi:hypothetical protein [Micromonospora sp. WMMD710]|uniref:hypothetical protein n=1 Tax=Micromonospora sp. WMMD710 TaxID=3016085 RepID=UPI002417EC3B|nr:hypothetical protein [Micromonospora sp. WMMD710]MDG4760183.1 hypothetical protein [Micromonospora sp. WMMD710]
MIGENNGQGIAASAAVMSSRESTPEPPRPLTPFPVEMVHQLAAVTFGPAKLVSLPPAPATPRTPTPVPTRAPEQATDSRSAVATEALQPLDAPHAWRQGGAADDLERNQVRQPVPAARSRVGDVPKAVFAALATAGPLLSTAGQDRDAVAGAVGMASATAVGDAINEIWKWGRAASRYEVNVPKIAAGVVTAGGIVANAVGAQRAMHVVRAGGLITQSAGLGLKGVGEWWKSENGWKLIPDGDYAKAAGAFFAVAAPILQKRAVELQRQLAETGVGTPIPFAAASAGMAGSTAAGEFFSEVGKGFFADGFTQGIKLGKINIPKILGGFFGMVGAGVIAAGTATDNRAARIAGFTIQGLALLTKAVGEAHKWEDHPWGRPQNWISTPVPQQAGDIAAAATLTGRRPTAGPPRGADLGPARVTHDHGNSPVRAAAR